MSSTPRAWPGVTVPADYYDAELFAATVTSSSPQDAPPLARPLHAARRPHPRLLAATIVSFGVYSLMYLPVFEQPEGLRLIVMTGVLILGSLHKRKDVVIADAGASLLVHRRTASADVDRPTEVTRDQIVCVRPPHRNRVVRYFRPAVWQVGPERILVDTGTLGALLAQHAQEDSPS